MIPVDIYAQTQVCQGDGIPPPEKTANLRVHMPYGSKHYNRLDKVMSDRVVADGLKK